MEDRRANEGVNRLARFRGARSRDENEYLLGSVDPGFVESPIEAVVLRISVFHCLSSLADDALRTNSNESSPS